MQPHTWQPTRLPRPWDSPGKNTGVACHFLLQCIKVKVKSLGCVRPSATPWTAAFQAPLSMGFSRQRYWSGVPLPSPLDLLAIVFCSIAMSESATYNRYLSSKSKDQVKKLAGSSQVSWFIQYMLFCHRQPPCESLTSCKSRHRWADECPQVRPWSQWHAFQAAFAKSARLYPPAPGAWLCFSCGRQVLQALAGFADLPLDLQWWHCCHLGFQTWNTSHLLIKWFFLGKLSK